MINVRRTTNWQACSAFETPPVNGSQPNIGTIRFIQKAQFAVHRVHWPTMELSQCISSGSGAGIEAQLKRLELRFTLAKYPDPNHEDQ